MIGNCSSVCLPDSLMQKADSLPVELRNFRVIYLFSSSTSSFSDQDIDRLTDFVEAGGGLYAGADNWPLQSESNQLTQYLYKKQCYGNFDLAKATGNATGNLNLNDLQNASAPTRCSLRSIQFLFAMEPAPHCIRKGYNPANR